jgi:hypothetical protein
MILLKYPGFCCGKMYMRVSSSKRIHNTLFRTFNTFMRFRLRYPDSVMPPLFFRLDLVPASTLRNGAATKQGTDEKYRMKYRHCKKMQKQGLHLFCTFLKMISSPLVDALQDTGGSFFPVSISKSLRHTCKTLRQ